MKLEVLLFLFFLFGLAAAAGDCAPSLSITSSSQAFQSSQKIEFQLKPEDTSSNFIIEYWIEDWGGNVVKQKRNTTNTAKKLFSPGNIDSDIVIKANLVVLGCRNKSFAEKKIYFAEPKNGTVISFAVDKSSEKLQNLKLDTNRDPKNERILKLAPYFLAALLTMISIALVWRR